MKSFRNLFAFAAIAAALAIAPLDAVGQTYPTTNPTYIPTAILTPITVTTPQAVAFQTGGLGTVALRITGTGTGIVAAVQGTTTNDSGATWSTIAAYPVAANGGFPVDSITSTGFWRVNAAGFTRIRVNVTSITGSITLAMAGTPPSGSSVINYSGTALTLTAQAAATVNSAIFVNDNAPGIRCTFTQASHTGTPSSTFSIQRYNPASAAYTTLLTSAAITTESENDLVVAPGTTAVSNVSSIASLPRNWRVSVTVGGSATPIVTGTVACSYLAG